MRAIEHIPAPTVFLPVLPGARARILRVVGIHEAFVKLCKGIWVGPYKQQTQHIRSTHMDQWRCVGRAVHVQMQVCMADGIRCEAIEGQSISTCRIHDRRGATQDTALCVVALVLCTVRMWHKGVCASRTHLALKIDVVAVGEALWFRLHQVLEGESLRDHWSDVSHVHQLPPPL